MKREGEILILKSFSIYLMWYIVFITYMAFLMPDLFTASLRINWATIGFIGFLISAYIIYIISSFLFYEFSFKGKALISSFIISTLVLTFLSLKLNDTAGVVVIFLLYIFLVELPRIGVLSDSVNKKFVSKVGRIIEANYNLVIIGFFIVTLLLILLGLPYLDTRHSISMIASNTLLLIVAWTFAKRVNLVNQLRQMKRIVIIEAFALTIILLITVTNEIVLKYF